MLKKYDSDNSGSLDRAQLKALLVDMVGDGHEVSDDEVRWDRIAEIDSVERVGRVRCDVGRERTKRWRLPGCMWCATPLQSSPHLAPNDQNPPAANHTSHHPPPPPPR